MKDIVPKFYGHVQNSKLELYDRSGLQRYLSTLVGEVQVLIGKKTKPISDEERRYYFGVIVKMIADHTGKDKDTVHHFLKSRFLQEIVHLPDKDGIVHEFFSIRSTTELKTFEAEEFYSQCRLWASEFLGITIPLPNECAWGI